MANSGANTNGSQFFIVYEDTSLPPSYTIWGKVTKGLEIVQAIAKEGVINGKGDGLPKRTIAIEKVKVR
jgi:peptidyl-prolyl cis-trans isomerase B (cyclophilin B)